MFGAAYKILSLCCYKYFATSIIWNSKIMTRVTESSDGVQSQEVLSFLNSVLGGGGCGPSRWVLPWRPCCPHQQTSAAGRQQASRMLESRITAWAELPVTRSPAAAQHDKLLPLRASNKLPEISCSQFMNVFFACAVIPPSTPLPRTLTRAQ